MPESTEILMVWLDCKNFVWKNRLVAGRIEKDWEEPGVIRAESMLKLELEGML